MKNKLLIKSKFSFLAKFGFVVIPLFLLFIPFAPMLTPEENKVISGEDEVALITIMFIFISFIFFQVSKVWKTIYVYRKGIGFRKYYSKKIKYISFKDLDGYLESRTSDGHGMSYDVIYLLKNKKKVSWICEAYYNNYYELLSHINLEHLGAQRPSFLKKMVDQFELMWYRRKYFNRLCRVKYEDN